MAPTVATAKDYVRELAIPEAEPSVLAEKVAAIDFAFDTAREQASVVGSDVIAFVKGITPEQRTDIVNAMLLAQLAAKKKMPEPKDLEGVREWFKSYFDVLSNIGFVGQELTFAKYEEKAETFEAHQAILDVAKMFLAGAPGALAIVEKTLTSLQKMDEDSPWITIFHRESRSGTVARFQVGMAEVDEKEGLLVRLMAFGLQADARITQVLFFKFRKNKASLEQSSGKATIDAPVLASVRMDIAKKIGEHVKSFVAGIEI